MNFIAEIKEEEGFLKNIFLRFKKRDFSGDTGQAMKNSSFQLAQNLIFKFGSLIFTIILARLLLPDRMGLYSLALSTIVLFASFSDLGISRALITFVSKSLGKNDPSKAKGYLKKLLKWKLVLLVTISILTIPAAYIISNFVYTGKPIFFLILAGIIYIPIVQLIGFIEQLLKSTNNFKTSLIKEILFQVLRITIVPILIVLSISFGLSNQKVVFVALLAISLTYTISLAYLIIVTKSKATFLKSKQKNLNRKETSELKKFIIPLSATAMAGMFFGYVDTIMLGHYVSTAYIAYYGAAFSLVGGATAIIGFMSASLMPIFARKSGKALESIFKKTRNLTILISLAAGIFTYLVAKYIVLLVYGQEYLQASGVLKIFSIMVVLIPIIGIYVSYFTTQKKTKELAWLIIVASLLNIVFNFIGITYGLTNFGEMGAVYGACGATILSRGLYLIGLIAKRKTNFC